jgi:two-component system probable response regulator PhcQ
MQSSVDYKQFIVLWVDDEDYLECFTAILGERFRILTAYHADEGLRLLRQHREEVGVLIANHLIPGHNGVWLLEQARVIKPDLVRVFASDMPGAHVLAACRIGIHRFMPRPYDPQAVEAFLRGALEHFAELNALVEGRNPYATRG